LARPVADKIGAGSKKKKTTRGAPSPLVKKEKEPYSIVAQMTKTSGPYAIEICVTLELTWKEKWGEKDPELRKIPLHQPHARGSPTDWRRESARRGESVQRAGKKTELPKGKIRPWASRRGKIRGKNQSSVPKGETARSKRKRQARNFKL